MIINKAADYILQLIPQKNPEIKLISEELRKLSENFSELTLDRSIQEECIKQIPVISTLSSFLKIGHNIRTLLFVKHIQKFIDCIYELTYKERQELIQKLEKDSQYRGQAGEYLLRFLDTVEDEEKVEMMAKAFKAYVQGDIDYTNLMRIRLAIKNLLLSDMEQVRKFYGDKEYVLDEISMQSLGACGLVQTVSPYGGMLGAAPNILGFSFVLHILGGEVHRSLKK